MTARPAWEHSASKRRQIALIAFVGAPLLGMLGRTWRFTIDGLETYDRLVAAGQQPILAFWHGRILPGTIVWRDRGIIAMTSENFDGEWVARILARFGFGTARGSTSRGGVKALVQMKRLMKQGHSTAFALDGPRGPAERAQPGAVWLAKATGQPILPFHLEAASTWHVRSWDRAQVPKPFSRVAVTVGAPFFVAPDLDEAGFEQRRLDLEAELRTLRVRALAMLHV